MDIKYFGHSSFYLKGKTGAVITDPFDAAMVGLKFPKGIEAQIVTVSHQHPDHNQTALVAGDPLVITLPGEYEKNGIRVTGIGVYHDNEKGEKRGKNNLYKIDIDEISVLHCGDLGHILTEDIIEEIGKVDILLVPVGGIYTIDPEAAAKVVHEVEPSIVIPMHYGGPQLNQKGFADLATVADFLKKMDVAAPEPIKKLSLKKEDIVEEMKVIIMEISS